MYTYAGYVDAERRTGFNGNTYGYIYTLAVHPKAQGRGVGRVLLQHATSELIKQGVKAVYLEAVQGLEKYYSRQGFKIVRRYRMPVAPVSTLPSDLLPNVAKVHARN